MHSTSTKFEAWQYGLLRSHFQLSSQIQLPCKISLLCQEQKKIIPIIILFKIVLFNLFIHYCLSLTQILMHEWNSISSTSWVQSLGGQTFILYVRHMINVYFSPCASPLLWLHVEGLGGIRSKSTYGYTDRENSVTYKNKNFLNNNAHIDSHLLRREQCRNTVLGSKNRNKGDCIVKSLT